MSVRRLLPVLAALLGLVAVFVLRAGDEPGGAGGREDDEPERGRVARHGAEPELQSAAPPRLTASPQAGSTEAVATPVEKAEVPPAGEPPPATPSSARRGRIRGRVKVPPGAAPETWVVVWQGQVGMEIVGAGRILHDGTFELDVPTQGDRYALSLRPPNGLWPRRADGKRLLAATLGDEQDVVLEAPELASFRLSVKGDPPLRT